MTEVNSPEDQRNLKGALGKIERRAVRVAQHDEFNEPSPPLVDFKATRTRIPSPGDDRRTVLEIRIRASYSVFRGDPDEVYERIKIERKQAAAGGVEA